MSKTLRNRLSFALVAMLAICIVMMMSFSIADGVSSAEATANLEGSVSFGHLSDIHYFPLDHCYQDVANENYKTSDFYNSMTGDTKLVLESGIILKQQVEQFIADAKTGDCPDYVFATGDLSKNGEVTALVDVANALRYMQNEIRKVSGYSDFQVFVVPGNHDLYNTSGALYSQLDGSSRPSDSVSAAQFALIFAGLGYPNANLTGDNGAARLTDYLPESYWYGPFTGEYYPSENSASLDIHYFNDKLEAVSSKSTSEDKLALYYEIGDGNNALSFTAHSNDSARKSYGIMAIDASDREADETGAIVRINQAEYEALVASGKAGNFKYYLENSDGSINTEATAQSNLAGAFASGENVYRSTGLDHLCGGRLTEELLDWMETFCQEVNSQATMGEGTIVTAFHQNALPHWEMEDEILKDFTIYNWENTAKRLLAMGSRYVFTGHMHVCDAMSYTDVAGRTLFDYQTGSCVSYYSPRRYTAIERYDAEGKLAETCNSRILSLDSAVIKEIPSSNVFHAAAWNEDAYSTAWATYMANPTHANWEAVVATNPDYLAYIIQYEDMSRLSFNDYIMKEIYSQLLDRLVSHFLNQGTIDSLVGTVMNMINSDNMVLGIVRNVLFPQFQIGYDEEYDEAIMSNIDQKHALNGFVQYVLDTVLYNMPYQYNGATVNKALDLINAVVNDILNWSFGDETLQSDVNPQNKGKMKVQDIACFILTAHTMGIEISFDETYDSIDSSFTEIACGDDTFRFQQPNDATYRKRMLAALNDMCDQLQSGVFVKNLLNAVLNPVFADEGSLLKTILTHKFDFNDAVTKGYLTQDEMTSLKIGLGEDLSELLKSDLIQSVLQGFGISLELPADFSIDAENLVLEQVINDLLPTVKTAVAKLMGFTLDGDDVIGIVQNFLDSYLVDSFYKGLGGIAQEIVVAFATDVYPDLSDFTDPSSPTPVQPNANYKYAGLNLSYLSTLNSVSQVGATFNPATQDNGRVPSRVTANFDTASGTDTYTIRFFTEENVYGTFRLLDENGNVLGTVSTTQAQAFANYATNPTDYLDVNATATISGVTVNMLTQTKPQYVPLIDLGLLCLTHAEIADDDDVPYIYGDRDKAVANSVIYWNVTTVTVSGLEAGKTYYYDVAGNYEQDDQLHTFSLLDFVKLDGYDKNALTFTTAKSSDADSFSFLTIADVQGMIQSMYDESHKAVSALLGDERTSEFDFILNAGDMCDNGKNFRQWGMALDTYKDLTINSSMFMTSGNHENGSGALGRYFNFTESKDGAVQAISKEYYSFDYANAHFIVLDTNDSSASGLGAEQLAWLENDLANTNAKWKFVLMHKSLYSAGSHALDADVVAMRAQLTALFAQKGVNVVFGGHDHTYTETYLLDENGNVVNKTDGNGVRYTGDGVLYITLGTMGTKYYEYKQNDTTTAKFNADNSKLGTLDSQTFGKVVVSGDTITYTGYYYDANTDRIEVIGTTTLTSVKENNLTTILLATIIPSVAVIGVGAGLGIYFAKKKKAKIAA